MGLGAFIMSEFKNLYKLQQCIISTISIFLLRHPLFFLGNTLKAGRPALSHVLSIVSKCTRAIRMQIVGRSGSILGQHKDLHQHDHTCGSQPFKFEMSFRCLQFRVRSFFGRILGLEKSLQLCLIYRYVYQKF